MADDKEHLAATDYKSEMTADNAIEDNIRIFGNDTHKSKFPNNIDGLKMIHRRILWALHEHPKTQKEASLTGIVMKMHPHGDNSINDTISNLAQPFSNIIPLVFSDSNIGMYSGEPAAAARYVDVSESEAANDIFFKDVAESTFTYVPCESEEGMEPENFIPVIPTTLLIGSFGIAIGFKTDTPMMCIHELCQLTIEYVKLRTTDPEWEKKLQSSLAKYLIPDFPTYGLLRNRDELISAYKAGVFDCPITTDGILKIGTDRIVFETIPYKKSFGPVMLDAGMQTRVKDSWINQHFQELDDHAGKKQGIMRGQYVCKVRRGENPFDLLDELKKRCQFTLAWKPSRLYVNEKGEKEEHTPFTLLNAWYIARHRSVLGELKQRLNKLIARFRELTALVIIADHADEVYKIFKNAETKEQTVPILCKRFKLTSFQAKFIAGLTLAQMTARGRADLLDDIEKVKKSINDLQQTFTHVPDVIISAVKKIDEKYSMKYPRKTQIPNYKGYACYKDTGFIQIESMDEFDALTHDPTCHFDPEQLEFHLYQGSGRLLQMGGKIDSDVWDLPKQFKSTGVYLVRKPTHTVAVSKKGICVLSGIVGSVNGYDKCVPVGDSFIGVTKTGYLLNIDAKAKSKKSTAVDGSLRDVSFVSQYPMQDVVIVHVNDKEPNVVRIDRRSGSGRLSKIVVGNWKVLGVYLVDSPFMISVPQEFRSRCPIKHLYVDNIAKWVKPDSTVIIQLNRKVIGKNEGSLQLYSKRGCIYKLVK